MFSNACKYAIRSILYVAMYSNENKKIGVKKISEDLDTPQPFLSKLLQQLKRNELISSTKGPNGGFYLSKKDANNTIWDVIKNIEGPSKFDQCFLGLSICSDISPCPVHEIVAPFKKHIKDNFMNKSISQYADEVLKSSSVITLKNFDVLSK